MALVSHGTLSPLVCREDPLIMYLNACLDICLFPPQAAIPVQYVPGGVDGAVLALCKAFIKKHKLYILEQLQIYRKIGHSVSMHSIPSFLCY